MTTYRIIKSTAAKEDILNRIFTGFTDWTELKTYFTNKGQESQENLVEILSDRVDKINFSNPTLKVGQDTKINFNTSISIPGALERVWAKSNDCRIYFAIPNYLILQQPSDVFERLLRLRLTQLANKKPESPFAKIKIKKMYNTIENVLNSRKYQFKLIRTILERSYFEGIYFDEINFKQKDISLDLLTEFSQNENTRWKAITLRLEKVINPKETEKFTLRIDRYGKGLLYGEHQVDRAQEIAEIFTEILRALV